MRLWWFDGSEGDVYFEIPRHLDAVQLIYHAGLGEVHFNFTSDRDHVDASLNERVTLP